MSGNLTSAVSPLTALLSLVAGLYVLWNYRRPTWSTVLRVPTSLNLTYFVSYQDEPQDTLLDECSQRALIGPSGDTGGYRGKKVYIDLGANDGSSLKYFFNDFAPSTLAEVSSASPVRSWGEFRHLTSKKSFSVKLMIPMKIVAFFTRIE